MMHKSYLNESLFAEDHPEHMLENPASIRVLIADDHAVVRTGLQLIFDATPDIELVGELAATHELLTQLKEDICDLLILDVGIPGRDTLDVLKDLRIRFPHLPVIMFSMYPEARYATRYLNAGASAYLNKERPPQMLIEAIRTAAKGHRYFPPGQAPHETAPYDSELSDREFQVLRLLAEGIKKDEIANQLGISKNTISNHRNSILKKLNLSNNADLTRYAMQRGLI